MRNYRCIILYFNIIIYNNYKNILNINKYILYCIKNIKILVINKILIE